MWLLLICLIWPVVAFAENLPLLDINQAGVSVLAERLPGIGPAKARAIVEFREENGPFKSVDALLQVKGIGPATMKKIRRLLSVELSLPAKQGLKNDVPASSSEQSQSKREERTRNAVRAAVNIAKRYPKSKVAQP